MLQHVETPHGRLAYRIDGAGEGPPLVLLQRFRGTLDDWDPALIALLSKQRKVIRVDNAGIGGSDGSVPSNLEGMADVALGFLEALDLGPVDLMGWSLGGFVAQHLALKAPNRIRRLIVAGSGPGGAAEGPEPHPKVRETMAHRENDENDFLFLFFADSDTSRAAGREHLARLAGVADRVPPVTGPAFMGQMKAISVSPGVRDRLPQLAMPVLVANGVHDVMIPAYRSYIISQEAPAAKLVLYPDAGHGFLFQHAEAFSDEVARFLAH
jgi:pimeloyl-ACP methyl ester carboxylesterase